MKLRFSIRILLELNLVVYCLSKSIYPENIPFKAAGQRQAELKIMNKHIKVKIKFSENDDGMETFEIKLEVNGNQESYYSMEPVDSNTEHQLVFTI